MNKQIQLLVSEWCPTCPQAKRVWEKVARETGAELHVLDVSRRPGRDIVARLMIRTIPAAVIDDRLECLGVPETHKAIEAVLGTETV